MRRDGLLQLVLLSSKATASSYCDGGAGLGDPGWRGSSTVLGSPRRVLSGSRREGQWKVAAEARLPDTASLPVCRHVFDVRRR